MSNNSTLILEFGNETISGVSLSALMTANSLNLTVCPENVYTEDQKRFRVYGNMPISILGVIFNIVNIIVFLDNEMKTQLVNHFLLALSISDLLLLICNFCFLVLPVVVVETESFFWNDWFPVIIRYSYPLALTAQTYGVYLTVLVSVHRFLGVCFPFKAKRWVTSRPVQYAIFGSLAFSVLINVPTWMELHVVPCFSEKFHAPSQQITLASWHEMTYIVIKKTILYTLFLFIIPFSSLIYVNWKIILALRQSSNLRTMHTYSTKSEAPGRNEVLLKQFRLLKGRPYSEVFQTFAKINNSSVLKPSSEVFKRKFTNSWRDRSVTWLLLAIVAMFLFCTGLAFGNSIVESILLFMSDGNATLDDGQMAAFERSVEISNILITTNSSASTFLYIIFSTKYRVIFMSLMGLKKRVKINRVAVTTALAAQKAVELSLIPDEAETRKRREDIINEFSKKRRGTDALSYCSNGTPATRRNKFRMQTTLPQSLTNSESNLRLMENQDCAIIAEDRSATTSSLDRQND
ncbi:FMRFamide receptor [Aphelenchoides besseyi]|nr:FMRFamide receptor [Aphelenchoides besseyi]KAI6199411.1 FMRFamide receptor [Aphelenchoides besseyi]